MQHAIQSGDTLYRLAQRYNVTVDAIVRYNPGIDVTRLQIGQVICIPTEAPGRPRVGRRAVLLNPIDLLPNTDAVALLDYAERRVIVVMTDVPEPTQLPEADQYVLWLKRGEWGYRTSPMRENPDGVYVGLVNTEDEPLGSYTNILITGELAAYGAEPTGIDAATAVL